VLWQGLQVWTYEAMLEFAFQLCRVDPCHHKHDEAAKSEHLYPLVATTGGLHSVWRAARSSCRGCQCLHNGQLQLAGVEPLRGLNSRISALIAFAY
jgi:hypothetical protein